MSDEIDRHMSWCPGPHVGRNNYDRWECILTHTVSEDLTVTMTGIHCDSLRVDVDGTIVDVAELDEVCTVLYSLRDVFNASRAEADCDLHPQLHDAEEEEEEDGDDEDGPELICDGCREDVTSTWLVEGRHLCKDCCAAAGVEVRYR